MQTEHLVSMRLCLAVLVVLSHACLLLHCRAADPAASLAFKPAEQDGYQFDTGVLRGQLRAKGKTLGLSSVVHTPSGLMLDRGPGGYGLFSHYRVFTSNKRYGTGAWEWPSTARLRDDGAVEVRWAAAPDRPFTMRAVYRWSAPDTLDLETIVEPERDLPKFESFLASYFAGQFSNSLAYANNPLSAAGHPEFLPATPESGLWQIFPRDAAAIAVIQDGRWRLEPNPVAWTLRPPLARPIAVRRDPGSGVTTALMAPQEDCFAIATPCQTEGHYSLYLSLFGRDLKAGETARARARLLVLGALSEATILQSQQAFSPASPK